MIIIFLKLRNIQFKTVCYQLQTFVYSTRYIFVKAKLSRDFRLKVMNKTF